MSRWDQVVAALEGAVESSVGEARTTCPFCDERTGKADRRKSLAINVERGAFKCHKCGIAGYRSGADRETPLTDAEKPTPVAEVPLPDGFVKLGVEPALSARSMRRPREYLLKRNVTLDAVRQAGIGFVPSGWLKRRVCVPISSLGRGRVGWVARDITGRSDKPYMYAKGMRRASMMFNEHALWRPTDEPAVLVEGVFDALPHWPHAVALLGKPSHMQVRMLLAAARPLVVALDGDAWREGWALAQKLRLLGREAYSIRLPPLSDPGDMAPGELFDAAIAVRDGTIELCAGQAGMEVT